MCEKIKKYVKILLLEFLNDLFLLRKDFLHSTKNILKSLGIKNFELVTITVIRGNLIKNHEFLISMIIEDVVYLFIQA